MSRIEGVVYRSGFVKRLRESRHLPAITFGAAHLPEDVVALVDAHLLDFGGAYSVPEAGDPIQPASTRLRDLHPALSPRSRRGTVILPSCHNPNLAPVNRRAPRRSPGPPHGSLRFPLFLSPPPFFPVPLPPPNITT